MPERVRRFVLEVLQIEICETRINQFLLNMVEVPVLRTPVGTVWVPGSMFPIIIQARGSHAPV